MTGNAASQRPNFIKTESEPNLHAETQYINDAGYEGGFSAGQIEELLASLSDNHMGWSAAMAPAIMGNSDRPELGDELVTHSATQIRRSPNNSPGHVHIGQPRGPA